jgi:hypothetical protein
VTRGDELGVEPADLAPELDHHENDNFPSMSARAVGRGAERRTLDGRGTNGRAARLAGDLRLSSPPKNSSTSRSSAVNSRRLPASTFARPDFQSN